MYRILKLNESAKLEENKDKESICPVCGSEMEIDTHSMNFGAYSNEDISYFIYPWVCPRCYSIGKAEYVVDENGNESFNKYLNIKKGLGPDDLEESAKLTEADEEDLEDKVEDLEKAEDIEDSQEETLDSEEDQEENPVEEESTLDTQLDELRDILVDLDDIRLYKIVSKDNEEFYILGKVANDSNDVEMLVDTQPIDYENKEDSKETQEINPEEIDQKYQFVSLPLKFDMIKDMNPKYGEDLNPNHEELVSYLMNLLVEQNPEAAEEQREEKIEEPKDEELPEVPEEINSEEEDEDEEV